MKSVRIRSYFGPYFLAFGLNTDQSNSNTDTIHAVNAKVIIPFEATLFILQHVKTVNNISLHIYSGYIKGNIDLK